MAQGWIKLHRQLLDNPIFKNHKLLQTFMYCLLKATHEDYDAMVGDSIVGLKAGQLATGRKAISAATGLSEQNVRTALTRLETMAILTIKPTTKYSIISITNWDSYQQTNQQVTSNQPTSNQQVTTNKNTNNNKNSNTSPEGDLESNDSCPHQKIIDLYHNNLPTMRKVKVWNANRQKTLRTRWKEDTKHQSLEFWDKYFKYISRSAFLSSPNAEWRPDLEWLVTSGNFIKVIEGKYHE